jgi:hypothetical protein
MQSQQDCDELDLKALNEKKAAEALAVGNELVAEEEKTKKDQKAASQKTASKPQGKKNQPPPKH